MGEKRIYSFIKGKDTCDTTEKGNIEIIGNNKVIIEHAERIIEYENERVRLNTGEKTVLIEGNSLTLDSYSDNVIVVRGTIKNISFE